MLHWHAGMWRSRRVVVSVVEITLGTQIDLDKVGRHDFEYQTCLVRTACDVDYARAMATRPTIHDVARRAGVSATTVSHAFSGKGVVSAATRQHVRQVARALGYRPDILAQGLRSNRLGVIALILRPLDDYSDSAPSGVDYFMRFTGAAALAALAAGYGLMLVGDPSQEDGPGAALACDGCLVTEPVSNDPLLDLLQRKEIPTVTVGRDVARAADGCTVDVQTHAITEMVLDHLAAAGARRVALVTGLAANSWNLDTVEAYRAWCATTAMTPRIIGRREDDGVAGGRHAAGELFEHGEPPDALYCLTGRHSVGALEYLQDNAIRVPDDVLLVCGSDAEEVRAATVPITAVDLRPESLARVAVTTLINLLAGREAEAGGDTLGRLAVRESTSPPIRRQPR